MSDRPAPLSPQGVAVLSALLGHSVPRGAVTQHLAEQLEDAAARGEALERAAFTRAPQAAPSERPQGEALPRALRRLARRWRRDAPPAGGPEAVASADLDVRLLAPEGVLSAATLEALRALETMRAEWPAASAQAEEDARHHEQRRVRRALLATRALVARAREDAQREAIDLALALTERLLGEAPSARAAWTAWLEATVHAAAARVGERAALTVHVHADDVLLWSERVGHRGIEVRADDRVRPGDLWLSSSEGALDLRRATVLRGVLTRAAAEHTGAS